MLYTFKLSFLFVNRLLTNDYFLCISLGQTINLLSKYNLPTAPLMVNIKIHLLYMLHFSKHG